MTERSLPENEYSVVATDLLLNHWWDVPRLFSLSRGVSRQLQDTPGLIGYELKEDFLRLRFSTLSVWESERAIADFIPRGAHLTAMQAFPKLSREELSFVRWTTTDPTTVTWEEALRRLRQQPAG